MANYVLLYKGGGQMPATPEEQQAAMAAWGAWFGGIGEGVVDMGNPFGPSASIAPGGATTNGLATGYTGYTVLSADSLAGAVEHAKGCPIIANGGTVEVYETFNIM